MEITPFTKNDMRAIAAEFLGTLFFVLVGTGAVVSVLSLGEGLSPGALVVIALAHGIGILTAVAWTAGISGGHINPAVTLALMFTKHIAIPKGIAYIIAQCLGAIAASALLKLAMPDALEGNLGNHALAEGIATGEGFLLEVLLTAFFVLVIYNTAVSLKGWGINAPIAIGLAIAVIHFVAVPFTGASVNPARTLGPALVANEWADFWLYVLAPAAGALIMAAGWLFWRTFGEDNLEPPVTPEPEPVATVRSST